MRYLAVLTLLLLVACGGKVVQYDHEDRENLFLEVKECMGAVGDISPVTIQWFDGDKVPCGDFQKDGCYTRSSKIIKLNRNVEKNIMMHEFTHHVCAEMFEEEGEIYRDPNHDRCKAPNGDNAYLTCSGLIVE